MTRDGMGLCGMDGHLWGAKHWRHVSRSLPVSAISTPICLSVIVNGVLFWLGCSHLSSAISIALAYVGIGACFAMQRARDGDHKKRDATHPAPAVGRARQTPPWGNTAADGPYGELNPRAARNSAIDIARQCRPGCLHQHRPDRPPHPFLL